MDPVAALLVITDITRPLDDRAEHAEALLSWLDGGGFAPVPDVDAIRAALAHLREQIARPVTVHFCAECGRAPIVDACPDHPGARIESVRTSDPSSGAVGTCLAALLAVLVHRPADDGSVW